MSKSTFLMSTVVGARIKDERLRMKMSQQEAADACGVRRETWGRYERDQLEPGSAVIQAFIALGADADYIVTGHRREVFEAIADAHAPEHHRDPAGNGLSVREKEILNLYRRSKNESTKAAMLAAVQSLFDALEK